MRWHRIRSVARRWRLLRASVASRVVVRDARPVHLVSCLADVDLNEVPLPGQHGVVDAGKVLRLHGSPGAVCGADGHVSNRTGSDSHSSELRGDRDAGSVNVVELTIR